MSQRNQNKSGMLNQTVTIGSKNGADFVREQDTLAAEESEREIEF